MKPSVHRALLHIVVIYLVNDKLGVSTILKSLIWEILTKF